MTNHLRACLFAVYVLGYVAPVKAQIVVSSGVVGANGVGGSASTNLPGNPEITSVNHTLAGTLQANPPFDPVFCVSEGIYIRSGDTFFFCAKASRGFGNNPTPSGRFAGNSIIFGQNLSTTPVTVRGTILITNQGGPWTEFYAKVGAQEHRLNLAGAYEIEETLAPGGAFQMSAVTIIGSANAPQLGVSVGVISFDAPPCAGQSLANEINGMVDGISSLAPILSLGGCVTGGTGTLDLRVARPQATSVLFVGVPGPGVPVLGGILWPASFVSVPVLVGPAANGIGSWSLPVTLPPGTVGVLTMQALVIDSDAVQGVAFSNALTLTLQ